jgi:hypothetical protein
MNWKKIGCLGSLGCLAILLMIALSVPVAGIVMRQINRLSAGPINMGPVRIVLTPYPTPAWSGSTTPNVRATAPAIVPTVRAAATATPRPLVGVFETGPGFLHGIVRNCGGEPVVGAKVCIVGAKNHCTRTLAKGEFRLDISLLEAGTYKLRATGFGDGEVAEQTVEIDPGAAPEKNFVGIHCLP